MHGMHDEIKESKLTLVQLFLSLSSSSDMTVVKS